MGNPSTCDFCEGAYADFLVHNVHNGDVTGLCFGCTPVGMRAMADAIEAQSKAEAEPVAETPPVATTEAVPAETPGTSPRDTTPAAPAAAGANGRKASRPAEPIATDAV